MTEPRAGGQPRWQEAEIIRIETRTPRVVSVFLKASLALHEAGQYLDVRLTAEDGYQAQRSYSIASAPGELLIELAVERMADGEVSTYFHDIARPGDTIEVHGPVGGHFVWRAADEGPLLLMAGGSGVAPLMSVVRHRAAGSRGVHALLFCSARNWDELIFRDQLLSLQSEDSRFTLFFTTTRGPRQRNEDFARRLDDPMLRELLTRWRQVPRHVYVCGSTPFVEAAGTLLVRAGIAPASIRTERFGGSSEGTVPSGPT